MSIATNTPNKVVLPEHFDESIVASLFKTGQVNIAEAYLKKLIAEQTPYNWRPYYLTIALDALGKTSEAVNALNDTLNRKPILIHRLDKLGLGKYAQAMQNHTTLIMHNDVLNGTAAEFIEDAEDQSVQPWPKKIDINNETELLRFIERNIFRKFEFKTRYDAKTTKAFTFGSCFAVNIAHALRESGINVSNALIEEDVNSTFANRYLMQYVAEGNVNRFTDRIHEYFGEPIRESILNNIRASDIVIMTVGVAPCFFDANGEFYFRTKAAEDKSILNHVRMRTTTVSENIENIDRIIESIYQINPAAQIVVTLSPGPLAGTTEMSSPILADCVSKSVLRAVLHEVLSIQQDVIYWPSFEIVKWLGSHLPFKLFSQDDGHSRHVSHWVIDMIMKLFVYKLFIEPEK